MNFETADNSTLDCSEGFYREDNSSRSCLPECGVWRLYSSQLETAMMVLMILLTSIGIVAGTIVVVVSCSQYKRM